MERADMHRHGPRCRGTDERGTVLVVTAVSMVTLFAAGSLSIDIGNLSVRKSTVQSIADAASMDARFGLNNGAGSCSAAAALADQSANNNGFAYAAPGNSLSVVLGTVIPSKHFVPDAVSCANGDPAQGSASAVQVHVAGTVAYIFGSGSGTASATGTWSSLPEMTGVRVGSYLANNDPTDSVLGGFLGGLLGPPNNTNVQAVGYNGLAGGGVTLGQLATALSVGSPTAALADNITYSQLIAATISALTNNPNDPGASAALVALKSLSSELSISSSATFSLSKLVSFATPGAASAADIAINVLDLVMGGAELENGQNFLSAPNLNVTIAGLMPSTLAATLDSLGLVNASLVSVNTSVAAIQAAQTAYGPTGTSASTAQVAIETTAVVTAQVGVNVLGVNGLTAASVTFTVPLTFDLAGATGQITSISCTSGYPVTILTTANVAGEYLGTPSIAGNTVVIPPSTPMASLTVPLATGGTLTAGAAGGLSAFLPSSSQSFTFTGPFSATTGLRQRGGHNAQDQPSLYPAVNVSLTATGSTSVSVPLTVFDNTVDSISAALVTAMNSPLVQLGIEVGGAVTDNVAYPDSAGVICNNGQLF